MAASRTTTPAAASLHETAHKTKEVAADVKRASEDLLVVNSVLEQELPDELQVGEVAQAIEHTSQLEKKLTESAESLVEAHTALEAEIRKNEAGAADGEEGANAAPGTGARAIAASSRWC